MTPEFSPEATAMPMVPVTIAAVGPAMLRLAGEVADGVRLHGFCTRRYLEEVVMRECARASSESGRDARDFEIWGGGFIATGPDEEAVAKKVEWVRYRVAFYGSTPAYWPVLDAPRPGRARAQAPRDVEGGAVGRRWRARSPTTSCACSPPSARTASSRRRSGALRRRLRRVALSGGYGVKQDIPTDLIQDIQRIPGVFPGFPAGW